MNRVRLLAALLCLLSLQGCWFVFIPGSVTGAISDSITGAEGASCVTTAVTVGDSVRLPDGSTGIIKSLSGTSTRCTDPSKPIRALIVPTTATQQQTIAAFQTKLSMAPLPAGWESTEWSGNAIPTGSRVARASNKTIGAGFLITATPKTGITDMMAYARARLATSASVLVNPVSSAITEITVNGKRAFRYTVTGTTKGNYLSFSYMNTIIEGVNEVAFVSTFIPAAGLEENQTKLEAISSLVQFNDSGSSAPAPTATTISTSPIKQTNDSSIEEVRSQCLKMGFNAQTQPFNQCVATLSK